MTQQNTPTGVRLFGLNLTVWTRARATATGVVLSVLAVLATIPLVSAAALGLPDGLTPSATLASLIAGTLLGVARGLMLLRIGLTRRIADRRSGLCPSCAHLVARPGRASRAIAAALAAWTLLVVGATTLTAVLGLVDGRIGFDQGVGVLVFTGLLLLLVFMRDWFGLWQLVTEPCKTCFPVIASERLPAAAAGLPAGTIQTFGTVVGNLGRIFGPANASMLKGPCPYKPHPRTTCTRRADGTCIA